MQAEDSSSATLTDRKRSASDWRTRIILGEQVGLTAFPEWLAHSYETLRAQVMDPAYPCFFGTMAERRGEMFYGYVSGKDTRTLPATMATFTRLASRPEYRKHNIAIFFEPDSEPLSHQAYHDLFWRTLQHLHDVDPDPQADAQPDPADETWEFSFGGVQMFVVCACPSFARRHSRNLGPGMVLLFQPRAVFVDTITNKVIGREARNQVRERLRDWDDVPPHPDLGFYGDPGNLEWKQYFLADENAPAADRCPFLKRMRRASGDTVDVTDAASSGARPAAPASPATNTSHGADLAALSRTYAALPAGRRAAFRERLGALGIAASRLPVLPLADRTHHFPLSFAQERLWFLWQLDPSDASYNIAAALRLEGQLAPSALRAAFDELVARHDILRTRFEAHDGHARQVVDVPHAAAYRWQTFSVSEERALQERLRALSHEPFDLTRGPLLRVSLLRIDERAHVLHIALHHIIADHASLKILLDEVAQAYPRHDADTAPLPALPALPALPVQYGDHAAWQREWAEDEAQARHLAYWVERLGGDPVSLMLPRLAHTAHANTGRGARTGKVLRGDVLRRLKHLAAGHRTTLFTTLLAAYVGAARPLRRPARCAHRHPRFGTRSSRDRRADRVFRRHAGRPGRIAVRRGIVRNAARAGPSTCRRSARTPRRLVRQGGAGPAAGAGHGPDAALRCGFQPYAGRRRLDRAARPAPVRISLRGRQRPFRPGARRGRARR